jgi:hypothetical protein
MNFTSLEISGKDTLVGRFVRPTERERAIFTPLNHRRYNDGFRLSKASTTGAAQSEDISITAGYCYM